MGYAIATTLADLGASVTLISGPTHLQLNHPMVKLKRVTSAREMYEACTAEFSKTDITVLSAAVADYQPAVVADQKIKKSEQSLSIELTKTPDIAAELGKQKKNGQLVVGFALETENEIANAKKKISAKNFDMIVLNSLNDEGAGFGHNTNKISLIDRKGKITEFSLKNKKEVANDIVNAIVNHYA